MNGLPKEMQKDKELRNMKISKIEYKILMQKLRKDRAKRMAQRRLYITGWYGDNMIKPYFEAVGRKDIKWFKNNCRCFFFGLRYECPACQMVRLFTKEK